MKKIGFIGMGNMASAIAGGIIKSNFIEGNRVYAFDIDQEKLMKMNHEFNLISCESEIDLVEKVDLVVLAIKPNIVDEVIVKIKDKLDDKAVISIVAGYDNEKFNQLLLPSTRHLSVMPNTPALVLKGMTLLEKENSLTVTELEFVVEMFSSIGEVLILPSYQMKAGGSISGCGPAFVYMFIEAMADGGVSLGLPRDVAYKLASQTLIGSGMMQKETAMHPGILKDQVCSPGGITIKGVEALEENGFRNAVIKAVKESN
ncbi:pyrroline-5-carboxylate reductase [Thomasclavelia cocleata]|uniref:Pyrroline-5-carboxylate reductase n=3 Tax=Thomasclavelia cocleata TaxID=69824 RepID=A0A829Z8H9_9FIRM|nr:pyrroline-5-carboxylate reductase [Thomasclavelia cocleata]MCI9131939.1 pyrroline-5-carboxylate reductase [Thomasclavelia cocleata]GFI40671.1 pyrroline-5-carboxylate reductase [Thomasclavelia cocleata]